MAVAGRVTIKANGQVLLNQKGASLDMGGLANTPVVGDNGVHGMTSEYKAPMIDVNLSLTDVTDLNALNSISNASGVFQPDVGQALLLTGMTRTDTLKITPGQQGQIKMQFSALTCTPVSAPSS